MNLYVPVLVLLKGFKPVLVWPGQGRSVGSGRRNCIENRD